MESSVYIDESGETGIAKVRKDGKPGASPYFVMAAAMMQPATEIQARKLIDELEQVYGKTWKHAPDLNHIQRVLFCKELSKINVRFFAIISRKETLGEYASGIDWDPHSFYNKCAHYLLERVGCHILRHAPALHEPRIVFEDRNHDFDKLRRYIVKIKNNPMHTNAKHLSQINPFAIVNKKEG